mmetsp:Transcript_56996/g.180372  ORF Transcript_56996/g.180372 Transcript_56996/m.180372 type:complete len:202 (-) Transcript_56996:978-1583(-)
MVAMAGQRLNRIGPTLADKERDKFDNITYDQIEAMTDKTEMRKLEQYMREEGFIQTADTVRNRMVQVGVKVNDGTDPVSAKEREEELARFRSGLGDFLSDMSARDSKLTSLKKDGRHEGYELPVRNPKAPKPQEHRAPISTTKAIEELPSKPPALAKPGDMRSGKDYFGAWDKFADEQEKQLDVEAKVGLAPCTLHSLPRV